MQNGREGAIGRGREEREIRGEAKKSPCQSQFASGDTESVQQVSHKLYNDNMK